jgi:titin
MSTLILIDTRLPDIDSIESSLTPNTEYIEFNYCNETFASLKSKITKSYSQIAIAQHNYAKPFCQIIDSMYPGTVLDIKNGDPTLESWKDLIEFLVWLKEERGAQYIDFLACDIWKSEDWKYIINTIKETYGIHIRASIDITGAEGNFILESDNFDTIGVYFTPAIIDYKYSFYYSTNIFYTKTQISEPIPLDASMGLGTVTVDNLSHFFGRRYTITGTVPYSSWQNTALTSDLSNVLYVVSNQNASVALLGNGNVVCWGWDLYGGKCIYFASELYNIKKIVGSNSGFSALRDDGRVIAWGSSDSYIDINTPRTGNIPPSSVDLTNIKDIYANYNGFAGIKNDGSIVTWGTIFTNYDITTIRNVTKIIPSENYFTAWSSDGYAVIFGSGSYNITSPLVTQILDVYAIGNTIYCLCQSGTTQTLRNVANSIYYTLPAGITVKQFIPMSGTNFIFWFSDNSMRVSLSSVVTAYTNIVQIVTNDSGTCYMGLKADGTVVNGGDIRFGGRLTDVPSALINNIVRLYSTTNSFGALKSDGTFIYFGLMGTYSYYSTFQASYPGDYAFFQNIKTIYESNGGYVFVLNDGTTKRIGKYGRGVGEEPAVLTAPGTVSTYTLTKPENKNIVMYPFHNSAIAVQVTPYESITPSTDILQYSPFTLTYKSNNQDRLAYKTRTYGLYSGTTLLGTFAPTTTTYTYTFSNIASVASGTVSLTIKDITTNIGQSLFSFNISVIDNPNVSVPEPPTINSITIGNTQTASVSFTAPSWNGGSPVYAYKYSLDNVNYTTIGTTSPFTLSGLTSSIYTLYLKSVNYVGDSDYTSQSFTMYLPPTVPTLGTVTGGNRTLTVTFTAPTSNGGSAITGYKYSFDNWVTSALLATTTSPLTITGLNNNASYAVAIKAVNGAGDSPSSATSSSVTLPATIPVAPTVGTIVAGNQTATVSFTPGYDGGSAITGYKYSINNGTTYISTGSTSTSFSISGLTNGTSYTVLMKATNSVGDSTASAASSAFIPKTLPSAPTIGTITVGNGQASVAFTQPSTGGSAITQYKYSVNDGSFITLGALTSPFVITGLTNGSTYYVKMIATNAVGDSPVSTASSNFVPKTLPLAPVISSVTVANQSAIIAFTVNDGGNPITGIKYALNGGATYISASGTTSPITITGLTNGTSYTVAIKATNSVGDSPASSASSSFIPMTIPDAPSITGVTYGNKSIIVSFANGTYNGSSAITGYKYSLDGTNYISVGLVSSPYTISTGLTNGTAYTVRWKSVNIMGDSTASSPSASVTPSTIPASPIITSSINGDKTWYVTFAGGDNGGAQISSYTYTYNSQSPVTVSSVTTLTFQNLTLGESQSLSIYATNVNGNSSPITISTVGMSYADAPVISSVSAGNKSAIVTFTPPSSNYSNITSYKYSVDGGVNYLLATVNQTTHTFTIPNLTQNVEYSVTMVAMNEVGMSEPSTGEYVTPYTYPEAPAISSITPGNGSAEITITPGNENSSTVTAYEYSLNNGSYIVLSDLSTTFTISDLSNGTLYSIKMKAINGAGASTTPSSSNFMPYTVPEPPSIDSVTAGNTKGEVYFVPGFFNGSVITKYRYSLDGINFTDCNGYESPITIEGLTNGTPYAVSLLAVNSAGESSPSAFSSSFVPFVTQSSPNPPTLLSTVSKNKAIEVHFNKGINPGSAIIGYKYSLNGGAYVWANETESPITITNLTNGTAYTILLKSVNNSGPSDPSTSSLTETPSSTPDKPIITKITPKSTGLDVYFSEGSDNGSAIANYYYSVNGGAFILAEDTQPGVINIGGLLNGTAYTIAIKTENANGQSPVSLTSPQYTPCDVPSAPVVTEIVAGNQQITVNFSPSIANGSPITSYKYCLDISGVLGSYVTAPIQGTNTNFIITGLTNGTQYAVKMVAVNAIGESIASDSSNVVIPCTIPDAPAIINTTASDSSASIYYQNGESNGRVITGYTYTINGDATLHSVGVSNPITIGNLINGTGYTFNISAVTSAGNSIPSNTSISVTPIGTPSEPISPTYTPGDSKITVSFTPGALNGATLAGYKYSLNSGSYIWAPSTSIPFDITGLINGNSYTVQLKTIATNGLESSATTTSSPIIPAIVPSPPIITNIVPGANSAVIYFKNGNANGSTITGYKYALNGSTTYTVASVVDLSNMTIAISGLTNSESYTAILRASSAVGDSADSIASTAFVPYALPSPPIITRASTSFQTASIYFTDGAINGPGYITGYKYSLDGNTYSWATSTTSPITIPGLTYNQAYKVRLMAATSTNLISNASAQSSSFVPYTVPNAPSVGNIITGDGRASIYVIDGSANGRPITNYKYSINGDPYVTTTGTTMPIVVTGLTNGGSYAVVVKSVNVAGDSPASILSDIFVPFTVPNSPSISSVTPGDCQLTVEVSNPNMNGADANGNGIIGYKYSLDGGNTFSSTVSSLTNSFSITGLTNGENYTIKIKSVTAIGDTPASTSYGPIFPRTVPSPPTVTNVIPYNGIADVYFTDGSANGAPVTQYKYSLNDGSDFITLSNTSPIRIYGLTNATTYTLKMKAVNMAGDSSYSSPSNSFVPYGIPYPATITQIIPGNNCVYVHFNPINTNGSDILGFRYSIGSTPIDVSGLTSPLMIPNLVNKTAYNITIFSYNAAGQSGISNAMAIIPGVPEAPVITNVVPGAKNLKVYFTAPNDNSSPITQYMFGFGNNVALLKGSGTTSPITVAGVLNGTPYDVYLVAVNKNGNSAKSNQIGNKIPYDIPAKPVITSVTPLFNSALVYFTPPLNNGAEITKYKYALNADTVFIDMSGVTSPILIDNVPNNVANTVKMIATNLAGDSPVSGPSKAAKYIYLPPAQIKVTSLVAGYQSLTVNFAPPLPNGAPITTYKYSLGPNNVYGDYIDANTTVLPIVINTGVLNNINYNIKVIAVNSAGESIASAPVAKPVQYVYLPPLAPAVTAIAPGNQSAVITFTPPAIRNAPITGYKYSVDNGTNYSLGDISGNIMTITGLTNDVSYNFLMKATSDAGDGLPLAKAITFIPVYKEPAVPTIGTVLALNQQLTVTFPAPVANGSPITNYEYTLNKGVTVISADTDKSPIVITGLTNGTSYSVQIRAINALGASAWSVAKPGAPKA